MKPTRLLFRPLAENQIVEAFNSYLLQSPARGQTWMVAVDEGFTSIEHFALSHSVLFGNVRRAKIANFPYLLLYFVREVEQEREAVIVACVHERSDPQTWRTMSQSE